MSRLSITPQPVMRRDGFTLLAIVLLAAVLRLSNLGVTEYAYDEARLVGMAQDFLAGMHFPTEGLPASMGFPAPPTMVFLVALPYLFTSDPLVVEVCVVALNLVGVALFTVMTQRYFLRRIALAASLLYACVPWAIQYSREIWPPHLVTPFVLAAFFCALLGFVEGRRWAQIASLPLLSVAIAMHYGVGALLLPYLWIVWRTRASWRIVAVSVAVTLLMLLPFFAGFDSTRLDTIRATLTQTRDPDPDAPHAFPVLADFASGAGVESAFELDGVVYTDRLPVIFWAAAAIPSLIGAWVVRRHPVAPLLYLWVFSGALLLTVLPIATYVHYLVTTIPALCLLAGIGLDALAQPRPKFAPLVYAGAAAIVGVQLTLWFSLLDTIRTTATPKYGPPLAYLQPVRASLTDAQDVLLVGGVSGVSGEDIWSTQLFRSAQCVRELIIADGGITVLPAHPFVLLRAPGVEVLPAPYTPSDTEEFPLRPGEGAYHIDTYAAAPDWGETALTPVRGFPDGRFDNGVALNSYAFASGRLYLDWSLPSATALDYQYFAHLLDAAGDRVAQRDASFYSGKYWCDGDHIITWIEMDRPADVAVLRVGFYYFDNGALVGVNLLDAAGSVAAPWVDLPLEEN